MGTKVWVGRRLAWVHEWLDVGMGFGLGALWAGSLPLVWLQRSGYLGEGVCVSTCAAKR